MHGIEKRFVYIIRSDADPSRHYVGITNDLRARLEWHNHGPCGHTTSHRPWSVAVSLEFPTEKPLKTSDTTLELLARNML
jgi:predicted GIY-YIG superfamily endonuclease